MSHPHELLMSKNSVAVTDLAEKTQKKIAKFATETDEDKRESLDESIYGEVEDFVEDREAKKKADAKKASHAAAKADAKKVKTDVSGAPTAAGSTPPPATHAPAKQRSVMSTILGRSS